MENAIAVEVKIKVPKNVDHLIRELCKLDGCDVTEFYQDSLLESIASWLNTGELFNLEELAKIHGLHILEDLDTTMYGKKEEVKAE